MNRFYEWSTDAERDLDYSSDFELLVFMDKHLFHEYEPTKLGGPVFKRRLYEWLDGVPDEADQKLLFKLTRWIYYVGAPELLSLYTEAYTSNFSWWLADQLGVSDVTQVREIAWDLAVRQTWFCPITDSLDIAKFHHLHGLRGDQRPAIRSIAALCTGDGQRIREYMAENQIERLVLLEDFVGSGRQAASAIKYMQELNPDLPILVCPLIICPPGTSRLERIIDPQQTVLSPVLELSPSIMLTPSGAANEPPEFSNFRALLNRLSVYVRASSAPPTNPQVFGFESTGSLTVLNTNCPNNAPPVIHAKSSSWTPLFPRRSRD
jgi:hypothetical protein